MFSFSVLVNSKSLTNFVASFKRCALIFGSKYVCPEVQRSFDRLHESFKSLGEDTTDSDLLTFSETLDEENDDCPQKSTEEQEILSSCKKPFLAFLQNEMQKLKYSCDTKYSVNPLYQPNWQVMMEKKWLSMVPFWTSILRGKITVLYILKYMYMSGVYRK